MKKMYCSECGGEIIVTREVPSHSFEINIDSLKCIDNFGFLGGDPELIFHCSNDREHNIEPKPDYGNVSPIDFEKWKDEVEEFISVNVLPNL